MVINKCLTEIKMLKIVRKNRTKTANILESYQLTQVLLTRLTKAKRLLTI